MSSQSSRKAAGLGKAEVIEIAGADALAFANTQFASDVASLADNRWQWSAWLSAQGRARCVFVLLRVAPDRLLMWLPLGGAAGLRDVLARFVLRAKVVLQVREDWTLADASGAGIGAAGERHVVDIDGGFAFSQPGSRIAWIGPNDGASGDAFALDRWRLADIAAGLPWIDPKLQDEFVPQALDLERIDAVRFDKGCYPGQEIAARLHFRGGNKRRLKRLRLRSLATPSPGSRLVEGSDDAGIVLYAARVDESECEVLAVIAESVSASSAMSSGAREIAFDTT